MCGPCASSTSGVMAGAKCARMTIVRLGYIVSFSSLAGRNAIFLLAAIEIDSPVAGFLPIRAGSAQQIAG